MINNYHPQNIERVIDLLEAQDQRLAKLEQQVERLIKSLEAPSWQYLSETLARERLEIIEHAAVTPDKNGFSQAGSGDDHKLCI